MQVSNALEVDLDLDSAVADVREAPTVFGREITEWVTFADTGLTHDELPQPTLWRVLVLPKQPKLMSRGGIALPMQAQEVEMHLNYIGQVVAMGPLAGKSPKFENPDWNSTPGVPRYLWNVKVGDWVIYGRYAGQIKQYKGVRFLTVNDDEITDVIRSPDGFRVYV